MGVKRVGVDLDEIRNSPEGGTAGGRRGGPKWIDAERPLEEHDRLREVERVEAQLGTQEHRKLDRAGRAAGVVKHVADRGGNGIAGHGLTRRRPRFHGHGKNSSIVADPGAATPRPVNA